MSIPLHNLLAQPKFSHYYHHFKNFVKGFSQNFSKIFVTDLPKKSPKFDAIFCFYLNLCYNNLNIQLLKFFTFIT